VNSGSLTEGLAELASEGMEAADDGRASKLLKATLYAPEVSLPLRSFLCSAVRASTTGAVLGGGCRLRREADAVRARRLSSIISS